MIFRDKIKILIGLALFLLMASFTVSSYAEVCHDSNEKIIRVDLNYVNNTDSIVSNESSVVQNANHCNDCNNVCNGSCGLCNTQYQSLSVISYTEKKTNLYFDKNTNDSLQVIPVKKSLTYTITYKLTRFYSSSLPLLIQTTLKHRILLV
jgi:hypothetical protein